MRAGGIVALVLIGGVIAVGVWWSTERSPAPAPDPSLVVPHEPTSSLPPPAAPESAPAPIDAKRTNDAALKSAKRWWDGFVPGPRNAAAKDRDAGTTGAIESVRMHVVDRATRAELDDVRVVRPKHGPFGPTGELGSVDDAEFDTLVDHGTSPIAVPFKPDGHESGSAAEVWVGARDHAWRRVPLDFRDPSERTVELLPAATLIVDVRGDLPDEGARPLMLRLRKPIDAESFDDVLKHALASYDRAQPGDFPEGRKPSRDEYARSFESMRDPYVLHTFGELVSERPVKLGETRFVALEPQELDVSLEVGDGWRTPLVVATAHATVAAGATARVALIATKVETPVAAPLAGTIFVPDGWEFGRLRIGVEPLDLKGDIETDERDVASSSWTPIAGRAGWYRWDAGAVLPARYALKVDSTAIVKPVVVPATGDTNVEIVLPESATLHVRLVDTATGKAVMVRDLSWEPDRGDFAYFGFETIGFDESKWLGRYTARVPVGRGTLYVMIDEHWTLDAETRRVEVHPGEQEVVANVHPLCGLIVRLACGGATVAWNERQAFAVEVARIDGGNGTAWQDFDHSLPRIGLAGPGRYTVTLPPLDGFEPVAPFEIEIPPGEFVTKTVELKKK